MQKSLLTAILCLSVGVGTAQAAIEIHEFKDAQEEARYKALTEELRCPKCQNQNLASSDAPISQDLKNQTYQMIKEGKTDSQIRDFMLERYGDFISYKPPMRPSTWILWVFPPVFLLLLLLGWVYRTKKAQNKPINNTANQEFEALNQDEEQKFAKILKDYGSNKDNQ